MHTELGAAQKEHLTTEKGRQWGEGAAWEANWRKKWVWVGTVCEKGVSRALGSHIYTYPINICAASTCMYMYAVHVAPAPFYLNRSCCLIY